MFTAQHNDKVYFSAHFAKDYKETYHEIVTILDKNNVDHGLLPLTKDYWCRDYMPVQNAYHNFVQFVYRPDYLLHKSKYITIPQAVTCRLKLNSHDICECNLIADGGNFVACKDKDEKNVIVMTEKIFSENPTLSKAEVKKILSKTMFNNDFLFLPWDKEDECGHTDGIVHNIGNGKILVNTKVYPSKIAKEMKRRLSRRFNIVQLELSEYHESSWAYVNMLQTRDVIIVPGLGLPTDGEALEQIKALHPDYSDRVYMVQMADIVNSWGGALNCLTWTYSNICSSMHHTPELDAKMDALCQKAKEYEGPDVGTAFTMEEIQFMGDYDCNRLAAVSYQLDNIYWRW